MTLSGLYWLASYPKSGNTWFRVVLANLLNPSSDPVEINALHTGAIASAREWIDKAIGFSSAYLHHDEIDRLRPAVYKWYGENATGIEHHKIHDAYTYVDADTPLIPAAGCLGALYFIRNPLDVAVSYANHANCSIDTAIAHMGNEGFCFCGGIHKQYNQLRQQLGTWSSHVRSWTTNPPIPVLVIRYEDMQQTPLATFTKALEFVQVPATQATIERALDNAKIEKLQQQEAQMGFREKPTHAKQFFRKGIVGDWKNTLTPAQVDRLILDHGEVMRAYGYLDTPC